MGNWTVSPRTLLLCPEMKHFLKRRMLVRLYLDVDQVSCPGMGNGQHLSSSTEAPRWRRSRQEYPPPAAMLLTAQGPRRWTSRLEWIHYFCDITKENLKKKRKKERRGYKSPKLGKINLCEKSWGTWQERVTLRHFAARKNSLRFSIVCRFFSMRTEGWAQGELSGGKIEGIVEKMGLVHNWSDRVLPTPSLWLKYAWPPAQ